MSPCDHFSLNLLHASPRTDPFLHLFVRYFWIGNVEYVSVDQALANTLWTQLQHLLFTIQCASYGFLPHSGAWPAPDDIRQGALQELALPEPPILEALRNCGQHGNPIPHGVLLAGYWEDVWTQVRTTGIATEDWILWARDRTLQLAGNNGWIWDEEDVVAHSRALFGRLIPHPILHSQADNSLVAYDPRSPVILNDNRQLILHPVLGPGAQNALQPYAAPDTLAPYNPCRELMPHPVLGEHAPNALVGSSSGVDIENPHRSLIPHPIYGPDAQNTLVLYRSIAHAHGYATDKEVHDMEVDVVDPDQEMADPEDDESPEEAKSAQA
ncbi:hypothetical protein C8Q80DRAFT_1276447 [Daedaleopsis nitida]|nr:hypothetical protein C8Q80DRAFT_1276447 [Daedaleopsis nitida]